MSTRNPIDDMRTLYTKYGFFDEEFDPKKLEFRMSLLVEEYFETINAYSNGDSEEFIDGLIDLVVIAIGTLLLAGVDVNKAWLEVFNANMAKERGVKKERPGSAGFDLKKNKDWKPPSHKGNHGVLDGFTSSKA